MTAADEGSPAAAGDKPVPAADGESPVASVDTAAYRRAAGRIPTGIVVICTSLQLSLIHI